MPVCMLTCPVCALNAAILQAHKTCEGLPGFNRSHQFHFSTQAPSSDILLRQTDCNKHVPVVVMKPDHGIGNQLDAVPYGVVFAFFSGRPYFRSETGKYNQVRPLCPKHSLLHMPSSQAFFMLSVTLFVLDSPDVVSALFVLISPEGVAACSGWDFLMLNQLVRVGITCRYFSFCELVYLLVLQLVHAGTT